MAYPPLRSSLLCIALVAVATDALHAPTVFEADLEGGSPMDYGVEVDLVEPQGVAPGTLPASVNVLPWLMRAYPTDPAMDPEGWPSGRAYGFSSEPREDRLTRESFQAELTRLKAMADQAAVDADRAVTRASRELQKKPIKRARKPGRMGVKHVHNDVGISKKATSEVSEAARRGRARAISHKSRREKEHDDPMESMVVEESDWPTIVMSTQPFIAEAKPDKSTEAKLSRSASVPMALAQEPSRGHSEGSRDALQSLKRLFDDTRAKQLAADAERLLKRASVEIKKSEEVFHRGHLLGGVSAVTTGNVEYVDDIDSIDVSTWKVAKQHCRKLHGWEAKCKAKAKQLQGHTRQILVQAGNAFPFAATSTGKEGALTEASLALMKTTQYAGKQLGHAEALQDQATKLKRTAVKIKSHVLFGLGQEEAKRMKELARVLLSVARTPEVPIELRRTARNRSVQSQRTLRNALAAMSRMRQARGPHGRARATRLLQRVVGRLHRGSQETSVLVATVQSAILRRQANGLISQALADLSVGRPAGSPSTIDRGGVVKSESVGANTNARGGLSDGRGLVPTPTITVLSSSQEKNSSAESSHVAESGCAILNGTLTASLGSQSSHTANVPDNVTNRSVDRASLFLPNATIVLGAVDHDKAVAAVKSEAAVPNKSHVNALGLEQLAMTLVGKTPFSGGVDNTTPYTLNMSEANATARSNSMAVAPSTVQKEFSAGSTLPFSPSSADSAEPSSMGELTESAGGALRVVDESLKDTMSTSTDRPFGVVDLESVKAKARRLMATAQREIEMGTQGSAVATGSKASSTN
eukprot:TRINITY_DN32038_c0_g2_i1.p1 TRINITY_DN32038_c0_g2~~TRINITY_DN32038_c0_g2_i1.p1  ORF type:complete len:837 (+),score=133.91 TRINITY_DN32038_c0_g2_i1:70-2511(+)